MQTSRRFYKNKDKQWHNFVHHDKVLECSTRIIRRQEAWIFSCHGKIQNFLELDICRELRYLQGASQIVTSVTHPRGYGCLYKEGATPCHTTPLHPTHIQRHGRSELGQSVLGVFLCCFNKVSVFISVSLPVKFKYLVYKL